ncbi:NYN domain-containing protein [Streptacidiphilus cavernicola]|uniref:NYN domain-containing protein n=1 Tax=Streptacidiphilus cavernicola TaxID=3342716 RepID=A0ABV6VSY3_9ACTN
MDRCVVLVDAGYLLGAAASLLAGESARSRISVELGGLIGQLRERAEAETGLPLLRIYWFDAAPDRRPLPEHRRLRVMPRVTVRLGALTRAEGRLVQKGVDAAMHAELSELARNRACADVVLVTGDGDLLPGMTAAKDYGVAVHLWAVQAADGDFNQSEDLVAEADERRVLDREWITRSVRLREAAPYCAPSDPRPDFAAILSVPPEAEVAELPEQLVAAGLAAALSAEGEAVRPKVPTPKEIAAGLASGRVAAPPAPSLLRWSSERGLTDRAGEGGGAAEAVPTLAQLTTAEQKWADREEDITAVGGDPTEVGQVFARRWTDRLGDPARLAVLWPDYPRIPHRVDGELLRYAARFGLLAHKDDQIDEHDRYAIRAGFWRELALRVPGGDGVPVDG